MIFWYKPPRCCKLCEIPIVATLIFCAYLRGMYLQVRFHTSYPINSLQGGRFVLKFVAFDIFIDS